jgi:hypothetical protein
MMGVRGFLQLVLDAAQLGLVGRGRTFEALLTVGN